MHILKGSYALGLGLSDLLTPAYVTNFNQTQILSNLSLSDTSIYLDLTDDIETNGRFDDSLNDSLNGSLDSSLNGSLTLTFDAQSRMEREVETLTIFHYVCALSVSIAALMYFPSAPEKPPTKDAEEKISGKRPNFTSGFSFHHGKLLRRFLLLSYLSSFDHQLTP